MGWAKLKNPGFWEGVVDDAEWHRDHTFGYIYRDCIHTLRVQYGDK